MVISSKLSHRGVTHDPDSTQTSDPASYLDTDHGGMCRRSAAIGFTFHRSTYSNLAWFRGAIYRDWTLERLTHAGHPATGHLGSLYNRWIPNQRGDHYLQRLRNLRQRSKGYLRCVRMGFPVRDQWGAMQCHYCLWPRMWPGLSNRSTYLSVNLA
jgi:hypothetical protein